MEETLRVRVPKELIKSVEDWAAEFEGNKSIVIRNLIRDEQARRARSQPKSKKQEAIAA